MISSRILIHYNCFCCSTYSQDASLCSPETSSLDSDVNANSSSQVATGAEATDNGTQDSYSSCHTVCASTAKPKAKARTKARTKANAKSAVQPKAKAKTAPKPKPKDKNAPKLKAKTEVMLSELMILAICLTRLLGV